MIGETFSSNNFGDFVVLEEVGKNKHGKKLYSIMFLATGTIDVFVRGDILHGEIKDKYKPIIFGVAFTGKSRKADNNKIYDIWHAMISRCYNKKDKSYSSYGGKNISVSDRWLCFEYFLIDVVHLKGYDFSKICDGSIHLDKDFLQDNVDTKVYSKDTCCFIPASLNYSLRNFDSFTTEFIAISPSGEEFAYKNVTEFSRVFSFNRESVRDCINGRLKTYKGWRFKKT